MLNKVILMGRLTKDIDMRQTPAGKSVARFTIAVNRRFKHNYADFINCVAWHQTGEFISRYFQKGSMIAVIGSIQTRSWDGQDGKRQYATEVVVDEAYFTGEKQDTTYSQIPPEQGYSQNPQDNYNEFADLDSDPDNLPF